jgi:hypothetical protein
VPTPPRGAAHARAPPRKPAAPRARDAATATRKRKKVSGPFVYNQCKKGPNTFSLSINPQSQFRENAVEISGFPPR